MEEYKIVFTKRAKKDFKKIISSVYKQKVMSLLEIIVREPYKVPPEYKILVGEMSGLISRRISIQHRLVYQVIEESKTIKILMMWTHYHE